MAIPAWADKQFEKLLQAAIKTFITGVLTYAAHYKKLRQSDFLRRADTSRGGKTLAHLTELHLKAGKNRRVTR